MLDTINHLDFEPLVNSIFIIHLDNNKSVESTLIDVSTIGQQPEENQRWAFSLLFHVKNHECLEQKMFKISHPKLDDMEIFIVPLGPDKEGFRYEAVFT